MSRLTPREVQYLLLEAGGRTQRDIALQAKTSQRAVFYILHRAKQRIAWILGPGSWFTGQQLRAELRDCGASPEEADMLQEYWDTTCLTKAARHCSTQGAWRTVRRIRRILAERDSARAYLLGLDELICWGRQLMATRKRLL